MQPFFETSGWTLPSAIATPKETKSSKKRNKKKKANQVSVETNPESVTKEADLLQTQIAKLSNSNNNNNSNNSKKKQRNKKRKQAQQEDQASPPSKKAKTSKEPSENNNNKPDTAKQPKPADEPKNDKSKVAAKTKPVGKKEKQELRQLLAKRNAKENNDTKDTPKAKEQQQSSTTESSTTESSTTQSSKANYGLTALQQKMKNKLSGAKFRWLNEQLYTTKGHEAFQLFTEKPELFDEYHEGFRHQVESWPVNPVDVIIKQLKKLPAGTIVADLGCGDAKIAHTLTKQKVLSFDLVAKNDKVVACDISKLPLPGDFVDVAVFSLSLMGTNYLDFLKEAHRVLKPGGELKIAEVVSRFSDVDEFIELLEQLGFVYVDKDDDNKMFIMLYFTKQTNSGEDEVEKEMLKGLTKAQKKALKRGAGVHVPYSKLEKKAEKLLKPCVYKKR